MCHSASPAGHVVQLRCWSVSDERTVRVVTRSLSCQENGESPLRFANAPQDSPHYNKNHRYVASRAHSPCLSRIFRDNLSRFFTRPPKTLAEKYFLPVPKALWTFFWRHPNRPKTLFFILFGRRRRSHATAPPRVPVRSRARSVPVVRLRTREAPSACRLPSVSSAVR